MTVIAPHPDDETLGLGATMATLCDAGVDVQVVSVSDGGAAYPGLELMQPVPNSKTCAGPSSADRCGAGRRRSDRIGHARW